MVFVVHRYLWCTRDINFFNTFYIKKIKASAHDLFQTHCQSIATLQAKRCRKTQKVHKIHEILCIYPMERLILIKIKVRKTTVQTIFNKTEKNNYLLRNSNYCWQRIAFCKEKVQNLDWFIIIINWKVCPKWKNESSFHPQNFQSLLKTNYIERKKNSTGNFIHKPQINPYEQPFFENNCDTK